VRKVSSRTKSNKAPARHRRKGVSSRWRNARDWIASKRLRRLRIYIFQGYVLLALIAFSGLALLAYTVPVFQPDVYITRDLQAAMPAGFGVLMQWISWPGYFLQSSVIVFTVTLLLATIGLRWEALMALLFGIGTGALNTLIKIVIQRPRPGADLVNVFQALDSYSFPSGHVMFYTAYFGFLLFLSFTLLKRTWLRYLFITVLLILIALVGVSRMYLGEHWASDVLGGYLLGSLVLILAVMIYRWGKERSVIHQPVAEDRDRAPEPSDEKIEIKEALKNPLIIKNEQVKQEIKEDAKDSLNDHHPDHPES